MWSSVHMQRISAFTAKYIYMRLCVCVCVCIGSHVCCIPNFYGKFCMTKTRRIASKVSPLWNTAAIGNCGRYSTSFNLFYVCNCMCDNVFVYFLWNAFGRHSCCTPVLSGDLVLNIEMSAIDFAEVFLLYFLISLNILYTD